MRGRGFVHTTLGALVSPVLAVVFGAGCVGVATFEADQLDAATGTVVTEPDVAALSPRALPAVRTIQSIHANGIVLLGVNVASAGNGDLNDYDAGQGGMFGLAFGNGQDVKRFVELMFVETKHHQYRDTTAPTGNLDGDATQTHFYLGGRWYLLPVTGQTGGAAPFVVGGICFNDLVNAGPGDTAAPDTQLNSAFGLGVYIGTGVEFYMGTQLALCLDVRASYWNWEGVPIDTGFQGTGGASVSLVYHY